MLVQWFQDNEQYQYDTPWPSQLAFNTLATVRVNPNGSTQKGWGSKEYMASYNANHFDPERTARFYSKYRQPFAYLMRSLPLICVDIDGKNGGIETSRVLALPPTFAETSKSGDGYHLFYSVPKTPWHPEKGYNEFPDVIGLIPGVDIKGIGAVYHYPKQRWNAETVRPLPESLAGLIGRTAEIRLQSRITKSGIEGLDDEELLMLQDRLLTDLDKPIMSGERNNRLYTMGARMQAAEVPGWPEHLYRRGEEIGLAEEEVDQIVKNVINYG